MAKLTNTSFTILGVLARGPWSAYELTKHIRKSALQTVWPRTESRIYLELKNLVNHNLATSRREKQGGRLRSIYRITPKGRSSLSEWLEGTEGRIRLESEPLLKILLSGANPPALDNQLQYLAAQLESDIEALHAALRLMIATNFATVGHLQYNALLLPLLVDHIEIWNDWLAKVQSEGGNALPSVEEAREVYSQQADRLRALCGT
ncbi:PadR family transcriptional regulator [Parahaliea mediterranea]|uniref:PadR family transcriptional regulator n=1 Tax=Parahaliea mediterranea TaxID=651086 RepID=A0A939DDA2_9GAMM|nr:PadR family transcriptional regulator [Parahaliea mediterranea]MBN7796130.1 PadR family transcriptional regulator [Parahaliea mediterranea]